jgi:hypothetical protein
VDAAVSGAGRLKANAVSISAATLEQINDA